MTAMRTTNSNATTQLSKRCSAVTPGVMRPDFCAKLLAQIGEDADVHELLDEVLVMEQGTQKVVDSPEFAKAQGSLGARLRIIEQGNLGGSGGYARGQLESVRKGTATYAMMMDDDVVCEPEGIIRAVTFGDLALEEIFCELRELILLPLHLSFAFLCFRHLLLQQEHPELAGARGRRIHISAFDVGHFLSSELTSPLWERI